MFLDDYAKPEAPVDLSKPSLRALSYLLKHPELWPKNFGWEYRYTWSCAIGLAFKYWNIEMKYNLGIAMNAAEVMEMSESDTNYIFFAGGSAPISLPIQPGMVASDIDYYIEHGRVRVAEFD